jgi:hypothetical protein
LIVAYTSSMGFFKLLSMILDFCSSVFLVPQIWLLLLHQKGEKRKRKKEKPVCWKPPWACRQSNSFLLLYIWQILHLKAISLLSPSYLICLPLHCAFSCSHSLWISGCHTWDLVGVRV